MRVFRIILDSRALEFSCFMQNNQAYLTHRCYLLLVQMCDKGSMTEKVGEPLSYTNMLQLPAVLFLKEMTQNQHEFNSSSPPVSSPASDRNWHGCLFSQRPLYLKVYFMAVQSSCCISCSSFVFIPLCENNNNKKHLFSWVLVKDKRVFTTICGPLLLCGLIVWPRLFSQTLKYAKCSMSWFFW